ncbi:3-oxoacyl-ACP synthase, partial [bacterium]|nr:3-oxoacyl-ACP synthase [bacterium]
MAEIIPLKISGIGYSLPKTVVTNNDLTKLYDTSDEWIYTRTGIKERRLVSGNESAIDLGLEAAKNALDKANIKPEELDLIISASSAPPKLYPAIACQLHEKLGITRPIPAFDLTAACSGLIYALSIAKAYIGMGMYKKILLVATDNNSRLLDWTDRSTSILFGDGAGAMVVEAYDDGIDDVIAIDIEADGNYGH